MFQIRMIFDIENLMKFEVQVEHGFKSEFSWHLIMQKKRWMNQIQFTEFSVLSFFLPKSVAVRT